MVIRHIDKRILGKDNTGKLFYNDNFKSTYYHAVLSCSIRRNRYFNGTVQLAKTLADHVPEETMNYLKGQFTINVVDS